MTRKTPSEEAISAGYVPFINWYDPHGNRPSDARIWEMLRGVGLEMYMVDFGDEALNEEP